MPSPVLINGGTALEWAVENPILPLGFVGIESDTGKSKLGNGNNSWNSLAYDEIGIDVSHNWGEQTAVEAGNGFHYFGNTKTIAYSDSENFYDMGSNRVVTENYFPFNGFYQTAGTYNSSSNWSSCFIDVIPDTDIDYTLHSSNGATFITYLDNTYTKISSVDCYGPTGLFTGSSTVPVGASYAVLSAANTGLASSTYTYVKNTDNMLQNIADSRAVVPGQRRLSVSKTATLSAVVFSTIAGALRAFKIGDIIEVNEGIYSETNLNVPSNCYMIAIGDVEIRGQLASSVTSAVLEATSTVNLYEYGTLENFKITAKNMRYPVHSDGGVEVAIKQQLINCELIHYGNQEVYDYRVANSSVSPNASTQVFRAVSAFGNGLMSGSKINLNACKLKSPGRAFSSHNNLAYNVAKGAAIIQLDDCECTSMGIDNDSSVMPFADAIHIHSLASFTDDKIIMNNCKVGGAIVLQSSSFDWREFTLDLIGGGNGHQIQVRNTFGSSYGATDQITTQSVFVVKITSNTADKITVSGSLTNSLLGNYSSLNGSTGINSYIKAKLNSDTAFANVNAAATKTITFVSGADTKAVNLTGSYANAAALVSDLNDKFGAGSFVASLYWTGFDWYPKFTNEIENSKNNGATAILRGRAVKRSGLGVELMTSSDAANLFYGIAVEDIPVAAYGDVKFAGYMLRIWVDGLFATTLTDGDLIKVNADGTLSKSAGEGIIISSCISNENIIIKQ